MTAALIFAALLLAGCALNWRFHVDVDAGGYQDGWRTTATFPDKLVHAMVAALLVLAACACGVPPFWAALLVVGAGALFEVTQGTVSAFDLAADAVGAFAATALWMAGTVAR